MEALQIAQMLADLNDLQAAQDQTAAKDLVSANRTLDRRDNLHLQPPPRSVPEDRTASPAGRMTDKFGRRMLTPPLTRTNSGSPSIPGTPRDDQRQDADIDRATTLLSLYEIRAKLKEQDNNSLAKAREKINALAAKQHPQLVAADQRQKKLSNRLSYPK
ncbi:hypothetical protein GGS23DRAFT_573015 [Durotheca rogersii]|uniref:uncharacterized protein n=1 Tax=Durotheca rogersii TaxID=419775 RepID=UPI00221F1977|nr:uncharacterized protein GGS23DRAFT_573015 [Durotheca rogersii]KAI5862165.1 hypothetical protein GGS23DRAFT_573015 [Durotheca rogersii]